MEYTTMTKKEAMNKIKDTFNGTNFYTMLQKSDITGKYNRSNGSYVIKVPNVDFRDTFYDVSIYIKNSISLVAIERRIGGKIYNEVIYDRLLLPCDIDKEFEDFDFRCCEAYQDWIYKKEIEIKRIKDFVLDQCRNQTFIDVFLFSCYDWNSNLYEAFYNEFIFIIKFTEKNICISSESLGTMYKKIYSFENVSLDDFIEKYKLYMQSYNQ